MKFPLYIDTKSSRNAYLTCNYVYVELRPVSLEGAVLITPK